MSKRQNNTTIILYSCNTNNGRKADEESKKSAALDTFQSAENDIKRILSILDVQQYKRATNIEAVSEIKKLNTDSLFQVFLTMDDDKKQMDYAESLKTYVKPIRDTIDKIYTKLLHKDSEIDLQKYYNTKAGRISKKHPEWSL